nr:MAG TPA: HNH endonuclease [Caudoviricetes sp.]
MEIWLMPVLRTSSWCPTPSTGRPGMMSTTLRWMLSLKRPSLSSTTTSSAPALSRSRIERLDLATEQWVTIKHPFDKYEVSDLGRVRNKRTGHLLTPSLDKQTWFYRMYPVGGKKQLKRSAGVLVWTAFVGWIPDGYFVQYRDGNRRNFWVKNLYLKSNSEFRKEEYAEGRLGWMLEGYESEFDEWIFGSCMEGLVCVR